MNILVLSNCPLVETQGSGYVIVNFSRRLAALGHQVKVIGPERLEVFRFFKKALSHRIALGMAAMAVWQRLTRRYDAFEFYGAEAWLAVRLLTFLPCRKFLIVSHSNGIETQFAEKQIEYLGTTSLDGLPLKWYQRIFRPPISWAFTKVDGIVTVSEFNRRYVLERRYQPQDRVQCIETPLLESFIGQSPKFERSQTIGFCGSWNANKGITVLCCDLSRILHEFPQSRVKLIGVGSEFQKGTWFHDDLCARIEVVPFVEDKASLRLQYESLAVLVMPSIYESFGLVAAEAMACGCALVANRTGFASGLRSGEEAILMPEPESPCLYQAIRELLLDDVLRQRVARGGFARVQGLRWGEAGITLEQTYRRWLEEVRTH